MSRGVRSIITEAPPAQRQARERFRVIGPEEWSLPAPPMVWDVRGVWPRGSFGPLGGEKKSLKSYAAMAIGVALATGEPAFGFSEFTVPKPRPVVYMSGEGGARNMRSRLQRIAAAYGVRDLGDVPLYLVCDAAPLDEDLFVDALDRILEDFQPGMVILDPLYAFHPAGIDAANMYERGRILAELSVRTSTEETSLLVPDHFRKTGSQTLDLDSIAQAGMSAWADSWILQSHRETPRLHDGEFWLTVEFGSREGYGRRWDIDWTTGTFDYDTGEHGGGITWAVQPSVGDSSADLKREKLAAGVRQVLGDHPWELTRTEVVKAVGGSTERAREAVDNLITLGVVGVRPTSRPEGPKGVERTRDLLGILGDGKVRLRQRRPKKKAGSGGVEV